MKMTKKRLVLRELIKNGDAIWVRNLTGTNGISLKAGPIVMALHDKGKLVVPAGSDPVCLSDQVSHEDLARCNDLFHMTNNGALEVLDPAEAESFYAHNEKRRALMAKKVSEMSMRHLPIRDNIEVKINGEPVKEMATRQRKRAVSKVNDRVDSVVLKLEHKAISSEHAIEILDEELASLTASDFKFLTEKVSDEQVCDWIEANKK
jgi:hypothetical protein